MPAEKDLAGRREFSGTGIPPAASDELLV